MVINVEHVIHQLESLVDFPFVINSACLQNIDKDRKKTQNMTKTKRMEYGWKVIVNFGLNCSDFHVTTQLL